MRMMNFMESGRLMLAGWISGAGASARPERGPKKEPAEPKFEPGQPARDLGSPPDAASRQLPRGMRNLGRPGVFSETTLSRWRLGRKFNQGSGRLVDTT